MKCFIRKFLGTRKGWWDRIDFTFDRNFYLFPLFLKDLNLVAMLHEVLTLRQFAVTTSLTDLFLDFLILSFVKFFMCC